MNDVIELERSDLIQSGPFIEGSWELPGTRQSWGVTNPANLESVAEVTVCGSRETFLAIEAAHKSLETWRISSPDVRSDALLNWSRLIRRHRRDLAVILTSEQGKPLSEAEAEISYAADFVDWFAGEARRFGGDFFAQRDTTRRVFMQRYAIGVVGAIIPWNFPAAMVTRKVAAAIAAGCTVVLKPSELTPLSAFALARLGAEAGIPDGVLNVVVGEPAEIGGALCNDPRVKKITFTGSTAVGKLLAQQSSTTLKKLSLELGGNAAFIVFDDCDLDAAVDALMQSKFRNTGQTCVCANRVFVHRKVNDEFLRRLLQRVDQLVVGPGMDEKSTQGPLINRNAIEKIEALVGDAEQRGARTIRGGNRLTLDRGYFYAPTVLTNCTSEMALSRNEIFGPVVPIFDFELEDEAVELANSTDTGLAAYVATASISRMFRLIDSLETGMVGINTGAISDATIPFGGVKESGYGTEGSKYGLDEFLVKRSVTVGSISDESGSES